MSMTGQVRDLQANLFESSLRFVVLKLEHCMLIVAQQEIAALEPVLDVHPLTDDDKSQIQGTAAGILRLADGLCPVYALDANLQCLTSIPASYRICSIFRHHGHHYAVACAEVQLLPKSALQLHAVPNSLVNVKSPIKLLLVNDSRLLLGTTSASLYTHLCFRRDAEVIQLSDHLSDRARSTRGQAS
jgi:hypothetical protein